MSTQRMIQIMRIVTFSYLMTSQSTVVHKYIQTLLNEFCMGITAPPIPVGPSLSQWISPHPSGDAYSYLGRADPSSRPFCYVTSRRCDPCRICRCSLYMCSASTERQSEYGATWRAVQSSPGGSVIRHWS